MDIRNTLIHPLSALVLALVPVMGAGCAMQTNPGDTEDVASFSIAEEDVDPAVTVQGTCLNVLNISFDSGIESGKTCQDGQASFTFTDTREPGGPLAGDLLNIREAAELCATIGAERRIAVAPDALKYWGAPATNLAANCSDYPAAGQASGLPARRWVALWGCCAPAGTPLPSPVLPAPTVTLP